VTKVARRSDQDIRASVSEELQYAPSVDAPVEVSVSGGAVTLSGEVRSVPEQLAAKRAAMLATGVKAVADEMVVRTPGTSGMTDTDIAKAAKQLLDWAVDVPSDSVEAGVRDHVITLSGNVTWDHQRAAAVRAVRYIKGVTAVNNTIVLRRGESEAELAAWGAPGVRNHRYAAPDPHPDEDRRISLLGPLSRVVRPEV
jgi:osmotically-inducible protein OsmY